MRKSDEALEKVFRGLREAEPSAGFEERMARRVSVAARASGRLHGRTPVWPAVAVAALLVTVGAAVHLHRPGKLARTGRETLRSTGDSASVGRDTLAQQPDQPRGSRTTRRIEPTGHRQAVALSTRGHAAESLEGFPAPPLGLTEQERLLLQAAQAGNAQPVASLEVLPLPTHEAQEHARFTEFFEHDRLVEQSTGGENE